MSEILENTIQTLIERFSLQSSVFRGDKRLFVSPEQIVAVCRALHEEFGFEMLSGMTAVDYWPEMEPRFHVVYQIRSIRHNLRIELRVPVAGLRPVVPTIESVYPNANWLEREIFDMFGLHIENHSDLRRILMPADWEGHPLRKDYPLGYEEVQFTFNVEEIQVRKPNPKD
jgi:NADH-quinone oxidoreductase subunit C